MPRKRIKYKLKTTAQLETDALEDPLYTVGGKDLIVARLRVIDRETKKQSALDRQAEIDALCGYPMQFTLHAVDVTQDRDTGDYGLQVAVVSNTKSGGKVDIENDILTQDEINLIEEDQDQDDQGEGEQ
jgi:hypothetical protein